MEGRRDHVDQAVMFDRLTAATLTLDQIVEMCDELIAAHGELLPKLSGKKSLVPSSGKHFAPVDPAVLRKSWDDAQDRTAAEFVRQWNGIGPFKSATPGKRRLGFPTPIATAFSRRTAGSVAR